MNLLLLSPDELDSQHRCQLTGRRHQHLLNVLHCQVGSRLRAGVMNVGYGTATVLQCETDVSRVSVSLERPCERPTFKTLLLAVPRPKVLSRCLQHAAALGYEHILLLRTNRVDKAHLSSHRLLAERYQQDLRLGLEQARRVRVPTVRVYSRFRPFVEDELQARVAPLLRFIAHPTASALTLERFTQLARTSELHAGYALAVGPEGGFIPFEVESLEHSGFVPASFGAAPLRVESALSYITGQLDCLFATLAGNSSNPPPSAGGDARRSA